MSAKVQPLHVNLPIRGIRRVFTQVLQTEVNKPMTIQMVAASSKRRLVAEAGRRHMVAFVVLLGAVVAGSRVTRRTAD